MSVHEGEVPQAFVSPGTRFEAQLWKATTRPSAEMDGYSLRLLPNSPEEDTLARHVRPAARSRTKMSPSLLVSAPARFGAQLSNASMRPSDERRGRPLPPSAGAPAESTLARVVTPVVRSRTNTHHPQLHHEVLSKATLRPSPERLGQSAWPSPWTPFVST